MKRSSTRKIVTLLSLLFFLFVSIWQDKLVIDKKESSVLSEISEFKTQLPNELNESDEVKVERVVDGDTIVIEGNKHVRYIGINTPEITKGKNECYGKLAFEQNKKLVEGKVVRLEKDVSETDKYGRLLRYVFIGETLINNELVKNGFARSSTYPPDIKYQDLFKSSEHFARENLLGLWNECTQ